MGHVPAGRLSPLSAPRRRLPAPALLPSPDRAVQLRSRQAPIPSKKQKPEHFTAEWAQLVTADSFCVKF